MPTVMSPGSPARNGSAHSHRFVGRKYGAFARETTPAVTAAAMECTVRLDSLWGRVSSRFSSWLEDGLRDFHFALRSLAKIPGFTAIAVIVIAVGIGSNTAVFSVINIVLLKPLPYPNPQSLVQLMEAGPQGSFSGSSVPKFNIWHQQSSIFQYVAAYDQGGAGLNLTGGLRPTCRDWRPVPLE
jgi:hypothetical protein